MNVPRYDPATHTVHYEGHSETVTAKEGAAFTYLTERLGQVVGRTELERDVWGMAPGVRSETVPVTMRNLRRKLTWDGEPAIETIRGVGWRLRVPEPTQQLAPLPGFPTPYQPRAREEAAVSALIEAGWRVVTVLGPDGCGKTRLATEVARRSSHRFAYCELSDDPQGVEHDLLQAVGLESRDLADAEQLDADVWILVDGVGRSEAVWAEVRRLVQKVGLRFLITSWRALEVPGEALHPVAPLDADEGQRFLRGRLAAAPWGAAPSGEDLARAVELLDGLPLGLELVAAHPEPLERVLADLESGTAPAGPEGEMLEGVLTAAFERLAPASRAALEALSVCEGPLSLRQIEDWLGADPAREVRELASRTILLRQGHGWRMRHAMRAYVRRRLGARRADLQADFGRWLAARVEDWRRRWFREPTSTWLEVKPLLDDVHALLETLPAHPMAATVWWLVQVYENLGPRIGVRRILHTLERRLGPEPLTELIRGVAHGQSGPPPEPGAEAGPYEVLLYFTVLSDYQRGGVDWSRLEAIDAGDDVVLGERIEMVYATRLGDQRVDGVQRLKDVVRRTVDYPPVRIEACRRLARVLAPQDPVEGVRHARFAVELARQHQLPILRFRCHWVLASTLSETDPPLAIEVGLEGAASVRAQAPWEAEALAGSSGLLLYALGDDERAAPLLEAASSYPSRVVSDAVAATRAAIALRRDEPGADPQPIHAFDPRAMLLFRGDGSFAADVYKRILEAEIELHGARAAGNEAEVIERLCTTLDALARPDDPSLIRLCLESLRRRRDAPAPVD